MWTRLNNHLSAGYVIKASIYGMIGKDIIMTHFETGRNPDLPEATAGNSEEPQAGDLRRGSHRSKED
jgi:hypothetical protein